MATRRTDPDTESLTIGGFLDSIIARRQPAERTKGPDHLANRTRIKSWLESLPITEPMRAKEAAFALLLEQDSLRLPFNDARTEALLYLDRDMHPHLLRLESDYLAAKLGGELETVLWRACSDLGRAFIVTYERAFTDNLERLGSRQALNTSALILSRIVHYLAWQARLAAYRRADWIPGRWQQVHRMYRKARAFNIQQQDVADLSDPNRQRRITIEAEYLALLLMWRLNSGTLSRTEIAQAYYWLRDRPRQMVFVGQQRPGTRLGVDPTQPDGLKPIAHLVGASEVYIYDSAMLAEPLNSTLKRLEERQKTPVPEPEGRRLRQQVELVNYLLTHWVVTGFTDRAPRHSIDRRVELVGGWNEIAAKLRQLNAAASGAMGNRIDHRLPAAAKAAGAQANVRVSSSEERGGNLWVVRDESLSGCRVVSPTAKVGALRVGDAVALHDPLNDQWDVSLVRRWKLAGEDRVELGVLWLARNAKPLVLYPAYDTDDEAALKAIDALGGEPVGSENALLLALLPAAACARPDATFERAAPRGKSILKIEHIELPGLDWCWARLAIVGTEPGVAGERQPKPRSNTITEIEITAPRE
jgi:hypothetical protein